METTYGLVVLFKDDVQNLIPVKVKTYKSVIQFRQSLIIRLWFRIYGLCWTLSFQISKVMNEAPSPIIPAHGTCKYISFMVNVLALDTLVYDGCKGTYLRL